MKFRVTAPAVIIAAITVVIAVITLVAQLMTGRLVETAHKGDYDLMRQAFAGGLKAMTDEAASDAEIIANIPSVRSAFLEHDRAKLLAQTERAYKLMEEKYAIDQAQFHLAPGVSFLRLHKPEKFGDEQASYRTMLAEAHQEKGLRKGVEITRGGPAIFGIVPILDDTGKLAGTFEMGLEFGPVLDDMKAQFGVEGAVFFQEKQLQDVATELGGDIVSAKNRVGRYTRFYATNPKLAAALVTDKEVDVRQPTTYERAFSGTTYGVQLVPLYNFANKQIGVVALATSFAEDKQLARRALVWQLLAAIFAVILLAGTVLVVIRGVLVSPLAAITERVVALAAGDTSRPVPPQDNYCEELDTLAKAYEQLRRQRPS